MMKIVIVGAGYAGVTTAYHLSVRLGLKNVTLIDERQPLTLTSNKGTEGYRNWWPDATMVRFVNRSIDLLEDAMVASGHPEWLNRRGYVFLTANTEEAKRMRQNAQHFATLGAGDVRVHSSGATYRPASAENFTDQPTGADLVTDGAFISRLYPFIRQDVQAMLHIRRAGFFNSWAFGNWMVATAQAHGVAFEQERVVELMTNGERVTGVRLASGAKLDADVVILAVGPYLKQMAASVGIELPLVNELHGKLLLTDPDGLIPQSMPFMFWRDRVRLQWTRQEADLWRSRPETSWMVDEIAGGVHFRPVKGNSVYLIWTYETKTQVEPTYPPQFDPHYAEVLIRGVADMVPEFSRYFGRGKEGSVSGGYYCKTPENRPIIGPLPLSGLYTIGALSGYGLMMSQVSAELISTHITGNTLPNYAPYFLPTRYDDPAYLAKIKAIDPTSGQL